MPLLHTQDFVVHKLQTGADLMTPGLQHGPPFPAKAQKGTVVGIANVQSPSVPMVVGVCEIDVSSLHQVHGAKGHAVRTKHWDGDELWAWSSTGGSGGQAPSDTKGWNEADKANIMDRVQNVSIEDAEDEEDGGVALEADDEETSKGEQYNDFVEGEDGPQNQDNTLEQPMSTKGTCHNHTQ